MYITCGSGVEVSLGIMGVEVTDVGDLFFEDGFDLGEEDGFDLGESVSSADFDFGSC